MTQTIDRIVDEEHPAIASLSQLIKLRYGARELTGFPKIQALSLIHI